MSQRTNECVKGTHMFDCTMFDVWLIRQHFSRRTNVGSAKWGNVTGAPRMTQYFIPYMIIIRIEGPRNASKTRAMKLTDPLNSIFVFWSNTKDQKMPYLKKHIRLLRFNVLFLSGSKDQWSQKYTLILLFFLDGPCESE